VELFFCLSIAFKSKKNSPKGNLTVNTSFNGTRPLSQCVVLIIPTKPLWAFEREMKLRIDSFHYIHFGTLLSRDSLDAQSDLFSLTRLLFIASGIIAGKRNDDCAPFSVERGEKKFSRKEFGKNIFEQPQLAFNAKTTIDIFSSLRVIAQKL
jgi:hypothetical protein